MDTDRPDGHPDGRPPPPVGPTDPTPADKDRDTLPENPSAKSDDRAAGEADITLGIAAAASFGIAYLIFKR
jgi:hypothetical protein